MPTRRGRRASGRPPAVAIHFCAAEQVRFDAFRRTRRDHRPISMDPGRPGLRRRGMGIDEHRRREARLHALLRRQDGVIQLDQARELGFSDSTIRRRVATKQWFRIAYRVYLVATHEETPRATIRAAMLSVGGEAVLVGPAPRGGGGSWTPGRPRSRSPSSGSASTVGGPGCSSCAAPSRSPTARCATACASRRPSPPCSTRPRPSGRSGARRSWIERSSGTR